MEKENEEFVDGVDNIKDEPVEVHGLPAALLLPLENYKFLVHNTNYKITIPRRGKYVDLNSGLFTEDDGAFDFLQESLNKEEYIVFTASITKILCCLNKYPALENNQAFVLNGFVIKEDTVDIVGTVIELDISGGK